VKNTFLTFLGWNPQKQKRVHEVFTRKDQTCHNWSENGQKTYFIDESFYVSYYNYIFLLGSWFGQNPSPITQNLLWQINWFRHEICMV
jgi:hypothetical protein